MAMTRLSAVIINILLVMFVQPIWALGEVELKQLKVLYAENNRSLYCGCEFSIETAEVESCNEMINEKPSVVKWEPLLSYQHLKEKLNKKAFSQAKKDLLLHVPTVTSQLKLESGYKFGKVSNQAIAYCGNRIDQQTKVIEPAARVKGDIARLILYLHEFYAYSLDSQEVDLLLAWSAQDSPSQFEADKNYWVSNFSGKGINVAEVDIQTLVSKMKRLPIEKFQRALDKDFTRLAEKINDSSFDVNRVESYSMYYFQTGLNLWVHSLLNGEQQSWEKIVESYRIYNRAIKESRYYGPTFGATVEAKMLSLSILLDSKDDALWLSRSAASSLLDKDTYEQFIGYNSLMVGIAEIIKKGSWLNQNEIAFIEPPYRRLFEQELSNYQFSSALQRASNQLLKEYSLATPTTQLFQVELVALMKLRKKYLNQTSEYLPEILKLPLFQAPKINSVATSELEDKLKKRINELEPLPTMHLAVIEQDYETIETLAADVSNVNLIDRFRRTPLKIASYARDLKAIDLLTRKPQVYSDPKWGKINSSNLLLAINRADIDMASLMLERGADANQNSLGRPPLGEFAKMQVSNKSLKLLKLLLDNGADPNIGIAEQPLDSLVSDAESIAKAKKIFLMMVKYGADVKRSNLACYDEVLYSPALLTFVLKQGIDPNRIFYSKTRPLHCAAEGDYTDAIEILLRFGADPTYKNSGGRTADDIARSRGNLEGVKVLKRLESAKN